MFFLPRAFFLFCIFEFLTVQGKFQPQNTLLSPNPIRHVSASHLQHQRHTGREEGHEDKVVRQDGYAPETAHQLQLPHACSHTRRLRHNVWKTRRCFVFFSTVSMETISSSIHVQFYPYRHLADLTRHGSYSDYQALHHGIQGEGRAQDGHALSDVLPHLLLWGWKSCLLKDAY